MQRSLKESSAASIRRTDLALKEIKEKGKKIYDKSKPYIGKFVKCFFKSLSFMQ